jgi:hypothetical protein
MRDAIYDLLSADATFVGILGGRLYQAREVGEISRQTTPGAFDANGEIRPCALLRFGATVPLAPHPHGARQFFELYFYERQGYAHIEAARERAYVLLQQAKLTPGTGASWGCWEVHHTDDVGDGRDGALGCSLAVSRYEAIVRRA